MCLSDGHWPCPISEWLVNQTRCLIFVNNHKGTSTQPGVKKALPLPPEISVTGTNPSQQYILSKKYVSH